MTKTYSEQALRNTLRDLEKSSVKIDKARAELVEEAYQIEYCRPFKEGLYPFDISELRKLAIRCEELHTDILAFRIALGKELIDVARQIEADLALFGFEASEYCKYGECMGCGACDE